MLNVAAEGGNEYIVAVKLKIKLLKDAAHLALRNFSSEKPVYLLWLKLDYGLGGGSGEDVDYSVHDLAAAQKLNELAGAVYGGHSVHNVEPLLKASG